MPPRPARWLLWVACPAADFDDVAGELNAEYFAYVLPERGARKARRWYWRQALRSVGALTTMGLRRTDWECGLLAVLLAGAGPALVMEAWWSWVLSLVPLKADIVRGGDYVLASVALTAALSFLAGVLCTTRGLLLAIPAGWVFS